MPNAAHLKTSPRTSNHSSKRRINRPPSSAHPSFLAKKMTPHITAPAPSLTLQKVDRVGVATSILCAIHCGIAPVLLLALPSFGRVWAHPASHILVAVFVVPIAIFSIRKGYQTHKKRWVLATASTGILLVLVGAVLPAFGTGSEDNEFASTETPTELNLANQSDLPTETCETSCQEATCQLAENEAEDKPTAATGCIDNCCPSLQVDESGKASLHIPPAAIVTTLGGFFLITAHLGNLCACGHACRRKKC